MRPSLRGGKSFKSSIVVSQRALIVASEEKDIGQISEARGANVRSAAQLGQFHTRGCLAEGLIKVGADNSDRGLNLFDGSFKPSVGGLLEQACGDSQMSVGVRRKAAFGLSLRNEHV